MTVSTGNSLVGVTTNDNVGRGTALTNGNYVINTSTWDNPAGTPLTNDWGIHFLQRHFGLQWRRNCR